VGAWGTGPYENDDAADLLLELAAMPADRRSDRFRAALTLPESYLDISDASQAVGAAALIAAASGMPTDAPQDALQLIQSGTIPESSMFHELARSALSRVEGAGSEWSELWDDAGLLVEATSTLDRIRAHL
jgi:hypothetical protein